MMLWRLLAVLLLLSSSAPAATQSPDLIADRITLGTDSLGIFLLRGNDLTRVGTLWDDIQSATLGEPVLRRIYRTENAVFGPHLDTIVTRAADFKPISERSQGIQTSTHVEYRADSIVGWRSLGGGQPQAIARGADPTLYDGASFDLIVRAASLSRGFRLELPAYLASQDSVVMLRASVVDTAQLPTLGGPTPVWVVEMDFAGLSSTMWIDQRNRALVQQTIRLAPEISILMTRPELAASPANQP